jgi:hypothetical protein
MHLSGLSYPFGHSPEFSAIRPIAKEFDSATIFCIVYYQLFPRIMECGLSELGIVVPVVRYLPNLHSSTDVTARIGRFDAPPMKPFEMHNRFARRRDLTPDRSAALLTS